MPVTLEQTLEMPDAVLFVRKVEAALESEQLRRREFYNIIDENRKMEFINGEIVFQSPVKLRHNSVTGRLYKLLDTFVAKHQSGFVGIEKILISLSRNDYEPDICFFGREKAQHFQPDQMRFPAPDFAVEVLSQSTEKVDREIKFRDYAAHGVAEYWLIDADSETIEQYFLKDERYELLLKAREGSIKSIALPDFTVPIRAVFDEQINLETLSKIIAG
ncbi:MAG: Uma2 family endonuclease [Pyrinomonadaceae bacterium]